MRKLLYIITVLIAMLVSVNIKAQIPANDSASWVKQSSLSDEFNTSYLDTVNLWTHANMWWPYTDKAWLADGGSVNYRHNLSFTGTHLKIKVDTLTTHFKYYAPTK